MSDLDLWKSCVGLYVGQLSDAERASFDAAVRRGEAVQHYAGPASMFGLGKVQRAPFVEHDPRDDGDDYDWASPFDMGAQ